MSLIVCRDTIIWVSVCACVCVSEAERRKNACRQRMNRMLKWRRRRWGVGVGGQTQSRSKWTPSGYMKGRRVELRVGGGGLVEVLLGVGETKQKAPVLPACSQRRHNTATLEVVTPPPPPPAPPPKSGVRGTSRARHHSCRPPPSTTTTTSAPLLLSPCGFRSLPTEPQATCSLTVSSSNGPGCLFCTAWKWISWR